VAPALVLYYFVAAIQYAHAAKEQADLRDDIKSITLMSDRTQAERYLLPIIAALWILGGRGIVALGKIPALAARRALAVVVAVSTFCLGRAYS
jgi:hypothetical protein